MVIQTEFQVNNFLVAINLVKNKLMAGSIVILKDLKGEVLAPLNDKVARVMGRDSRLRWMVKLETESIKDENQKIIHKFTRKKMMPAAKFLAKVKHL